MGTLRFFFGNLTGWVWGYHETRCLYEIKNEFALT